MPRGTIGHVCTICEEIVPEHAEVVSCEFYMCPKCRTFFREYMLARMKEKEGSAYHTMQHHD